MNRAIEFLYYDAITDQSIRKAYAEPHRVYHTFTHVDNMIAHIDEWEQSWFSCKDICTDLTVDDPIDEIEYMYAMRVAAVFHDIVYKPGVARGINELESAHKFVEYATPYDLNDTLMNFIQKLIIATAKPEDYVKGEKYERLSKSKTKDAKKGAALYLSCSWFVRMDWPNWHLYDLPGFLPPPFYMHHIHIDVVKSLIDWEDKIFKEFKGAENLEAYVTGRKAFLEKALKDGLITPAEHELVVYLVDQHTA